MIDAHVISLLSLGFVLGARHALDADHLVAVATILSERPRVKLSGLIGLCWGVGHTLTLLLVGVLVLTLHIAIPELVAQAMEAAVGFMLVALGISLALKVVRGRWHVHAHHHDGETHVHVHTHRVSELHGHDHWIRQSIKPLAVGMAHGLAGSSALVLLVLGSAQTVGQGVAYIGLFGLGSILGMVLLGLAITVPLSLSASCGRHALVAVQSVTTVASIGLGFLILYRIGLMIGPF